MLHPVGKQVYKLELPKTKRIYNAFYVLLLEQDTTKEERDENAVELDTDDNSKKYELEAIWDSAIYVKESKSDHLPDLYYLVLWKRYLEEENTWELASTIQHLKKLISLFHKDHPDKPTATSLAINTIPSVARPIVKPIEPLKQKWEWLKRCTTKRVKWGNKEKSESVWFSIESEASRRSEICLFGAGVLGSLHLGRWNYLQFDRAKNQIASYSDHVSLLITNLGFSFSVFSLG